MPRPRRQSRWFQLDPKQAERISTLAHNPAWQELRGLVLTARENYFTNMARGLAASKNPVDQREVDEKRGFWAGAVWAVELLVQKADKEFEAILAEQMEEAERR